MSKLWILYAYLRAKLLAQVLRTRPRLEAWQRFRVRRHLSWVRRHSPYYRELAELPDHPELPVMDKTSMMKNFSRLNTRGIDRDEAMSLAFEAERSRDFSPMLGDVTVGLSSGTSGHRGLFLVSPKERYFHAGTMLAKVLPGSLFERHRVAFFLRANSNLYSTSRSRLLQFEFFDLLDPLGRHVERLNRLQPTLIFAPPSILRRLAEEAAEGRLRVSPRKVLSVAETLDPLDERFIREAFGLPVHQVYQCTEGFLGISCREGTIHLNEELVRIEKEWLDREAGKFIPIVTDFSRTTQPILRYRMNDILTLKKEPCPCGSPNLALSAIEGRSDDMIQLVSLEDGRSPLPVFPDFIRRAILMASDDITEYRVVQRRVGELEIALKLRAGSDAEATLGAVLGELRLLSERLGARVPSVQFTEEFPVLGLRKLRRVESQLKAEPLASH